MDDPAHDHDLELVERDLERPDVCGVVQYINGKAWVCVRAAHDDPPRPGHGQRSEQPTAYGYAPRSRRHYFRRRYPGTNH